MDDNILISEALKKVMSEKTSIKTATVRKGNSSGIIYVPKRFEGKTVTVVLHENP